jgi:uncharacterized membrane protein
MNQLWLFLHFMGLVFGAGPGVANAMIMRAVPTATPEGAAALRKVPPILVNVSTIGVAVLWITGLIMVWTVFGGVANLPGMFWVKIAFVVVLTVIVIAMQITLAEIRKTGNMALAARMRILGPLAGVSATLAVLFAVVAFG